MAFNFSAVQLDCFSEPGPDSSSKDAHRRPQRSRRNPLATSASGQTKHQVVR